MATIRVNLASEAARLRSVLQPLLSIEAGLGADGIGHGRLRPPSEQLVNPGEASEEVEPGEQEQA